jgi:hypothetical protein
VENTAPMTSGASIGRRASTAFVALAVGALAALAVVPSSAGASSSSAKVLTHDLLPSSYANGVGFTEVAMTATSSSKTGVTSCPLGAEAAFDDESNQTGVVSEVLECRNKAAAAKILSGVVAETSASSSPPRRLGSSAIERSSSGPIYTICWRRGTVVEFVALETKLSSSTSSSSTTTTTAPAPPITADQQMVLSAAALKQDSRFS